MIRSAVLIQSTRVTDERTDGRNWRSIYRAQHSVARKKIANPVTRRPVWSCKRWAIICDTGKWKGAIDVAVKTMKPGTMSVEKFLEEAEVMKKLRHRRLVTLYAVCTHGDPIYIVTELMTGGSLLALLRKQSKNKQPIATDVLIDMAAQVRRPTPFQVPS